MQKFYLKITAALTQHPATVQVTNISKYQGNLRDASPHPQVHANITYKSNDAPSDVGDAKTDITAAINAAANTLGDDIIGNITVQSKHVYPVSLQKFATGTVKKSATLQLPQLPLTLHLPQLLWLPLTLQLLQ